MQDGKQKLTANDIVLALRNSSKQEQAALLGAFAPIIHRVLIGRLQTAARFATNSCGQSQDLASVLLSLDDYLNWEQGTPKFLDRSVQ